MSDAALRFVDVSCQFGHEQVVNKVSFDVQPSEIVCLLGPSGCGKTTSLRLAGGMETLSGGEIWMAGQCVANQQMARPPETRGIGFLFQDFALFPHLSIADNISFGIRNLADSEKRARVSMLLEKVDLAGFEDKFPDTLSGGEQQRAALARALAPRPWAGKRPFAAISRARFCLGPSTWRRFIVITVPTGIRGRRPVVWPVPRWWTMCSPVRVMWPL